MCSRGQGVYRKSSYHVGAPPPKRNARPKWSSEASRTGRAQPSKAGAARRRSEVQQETAVVPPWRQPQGEDATSPRAKQMPRGREPPDSWVCPICGGEFNRYDCKGRCTACLGTRAWPGDTRGGWDDQGVIQSWPKKKRRVFYMAVHSPDPAEDSDEEEEQLRIESVTG